MNADEKTGDGRTRNLVAAVVCPEYSYDAVRQAVLRALQAARIGPEIVPDGGTVLVKPNLVSPHSPDAAVTTHPTVVAAVADIMSEWGAGRVWIADSPAGTHPVSRLYGDTEMTAAAERSGATLMAADDGPVRARQCGPETVPVPGWFDEVDFTVSVPKLKTHGLTGITCGMKNMFGVVVGAAKSMVHARHPAPASLSRALVDIWTHLQADVTVVDAVVAMEGQGPTNGRPACVGVVAAGRNAAAVDAVCVRAISGGAHSAPMIREAVMRGLCPPGADIPVTGDGLERIEQAHLSPSIARFLTRLPPGMFQWATWILSAKPRISQRKCVRCGTCAEVCSTGAIRRDADGAFRVDRSRCILCMCCMESCPHQAIRVRSPLVWLSRASASRRRERRQETGAPPEKAAENFDP